MELIDRKEVVDLICDSKDLKELFDRVYDEIPIIESRPKGKWDTVSREKGACEIFFTNKKCSNCGYEYCFPFYYNYCPNCGARMENE